MTRRFVFVWLFFGLAFLGLAARLVAVQVIEHDRWATLARRIQEDEFTHPGPRGRILDRHGILLAQDLPALSIALDNYHMTRPELLLPLLQEELDLPAEVLAEKIYREGYFTWIARQVDLDTAQAVRARAEALGVRGLLFLNEPRRVYPQGALASNVIGFVGVDHRGLEGVELAYDELLAGEEEVVRVKKTARGTELEREVLEDGGPGLDLMLTLDARVQHLAETELDAGLRRFRAKDGFVVVLDPRTGEVLALAQARRYDLNAYASSNAAQRLNEPVARAYEPGSLFKVFAGLAALEAGVVSLSDRFDGDAPVRLGGHAFRNAEPYRFGRVTLKEIIQNSLNVGMIRVVQRLGAAGLHAYLERLGFGRPTGSGLPGELGGSLLPLERWSPLELGAVAIGQAVSVTGLQLASRLGALANEGRLMRPFVLLRALGPDGQVRLENHPRLERVIASPLNTARMVAMMEAVVRAGTGTAARLERFAVAGKSGTAQKALPGRGYVPGKYISSFAGFFPVQAPRYLILVVLDEVGTQPIWGGHTAGSVFKALAERLIDLDDLYP